jgi:cytochrome c-type biogenesis protein CcmH/NrfG
MRIVSAQSTHWTDEQLIDHIYGLGPVDDHLTNCEACRTRLSAMQARRQQISVEEQVADNFLASQRRTIYARLSAPHRWWHELSVGRLAAAAVMFLTLAGSAAFYQTHQRNIAEAKADAQLAQDVSQMSFESEPSATAPLQGLFVQ